MRIKAYLVAAALALVVWFVFRRAPETTLDAADLSATERAAASGATPLEPIREVAPTIDPVASPTQAETSQVSLAGPTAPGSSGATLVFGRVLPPRGEEAFAEAPSCALYDERGTHRSVECAEDGQFAISGVVAGRYWICAGDGGGASGRAEFATLSGREQLEVDVQLERRWSVEVHVRSTNGQELSALWSIAVATLEPLEDWFDEPRGSSSNPYGVGHFRAAKLGSAETGTGVRGLLVMDVDVPVWVHLVYGHRVIARERIAPPQSEVEFVLDPSDPVTQAPTLRGRLIDAITGEPLRSTKIMVTSQAAGPRTTDGDGCFHVDKFLAPGLCRLSLRSSGYAWDQLVRLQPGTETDLGDVRVEGGVSIEGRVIGSRGTERERTVRYEMLDEQTGKLVWNGMFTYTRIEADGSFRITGLAPRRYQLNIDGGGDTAMQRHVVDLRNGSVAGLEFTLPRASTLAVVLDGPGQRSETVEFRDEAGTLLMAPKLWPGPPLPFKLTPGRYTLKLGDVERTVVLGSEPLLVRLP